MLFIGELPEIIYIDNCRWVFIERSWIFTAWMGHSNIGAATPPFGQGNALKPQQLPHKYGTLPTNPLILPPSRGSQFNPIPNEA